MHFSIFENDGGLGQLDNARSVVLRGATTVNALFNSSAFPIGDWIKKALEGAGFAVTNVRWSWASSLPFGGNAANVEIEIELFNWHTSDEARVNAIRAIETYTANYGLNKVFSNTTLSVAFDAYVPPASGSGSTKGGTKSTGKGSPPSSYDLSNAGSGGSAFLDNLGLGLGVSTPIVLLGGGLILLLILRR